MEETQIIMPEYSEPPADIEEKVKQVVAQHIDEEGIRLTKGFVNLARQQGDDIHLKWLGMQLYIAGKLTGILQEKAKHEEQEGE